VMMNMWPVAQPQTGEPHERAYSLMIMGGNGRGIFQSILLKSGKGKNKHRYPHSSV